MGDCGAKLGQDGIDNGFIILNNVRVPRVNLLNRFSDVNEEGKFVTKVPQPGQRLAMSLGALSKGRILVMTSANFIAFYGIKIALRYSVLRTQFGLAHSKEECSLLDYQLQQHRIFPYYARAVGGVKASHFIHALWNKNLKKIFKPGNFKLAEVHAMISCLKAVNTWNCGKAL